MVKLQANSKVIVFSLVGILLVGGLGFGVMKFRELQREVQKLKTNPQALQDAAKADEKKLVDQVAKLIALPKDETPTVATVSDSEKLKVNEFFVNSKNGDKVLIYSGAKKAILFRPGENKIIEVGPVSIGTPSASIAPAQVTFALYNGTDVTGLTKSYETTLKTKVSGAVVADRDNAAKRDYAKTILVDLNNKTSQAASLAQALGISVGALPDGESKPAGADFLIIVGSDQQ